MKIKERAKIAFLVALAVIVVDQLTKFYVYGYWLFKDNIALPVINDFLYIKLVKNTGVGFGIMQGQNNIAIWITIIFIGLIIYYLDEIMENKNTAILAGLLIGGAIGNLMDRICMGFVRDFIAFTFWPAFNAADAAITIGGIGLIIYFLKKK